MGKVKSIVTTESVIMSVIPMNFQDGDMEKMVILSTTKYPVSTSVKITASEARELANALLLAIEYLEEEAIS